MNRLELLLQFQLYKSSENLKIKHFFMNFDGILTLRKENFALQRSTSAQNIKITGNQLRDNQFRLCRNLIIREPRSNSSSKNSTIDDRLRHVVIDARVFFQSIRLYRRFLFQLKKQHPKSITTIFYQFKHRV